MTFTVTSASSEAEVSELSSDSADFGFVEENFLREAAAGPAG
jgi:hypothetical protein